jgi:hypothetical protein
MQYVAPKKGPEPRRTPARSVTSANLELARAATAAAADGLVDLLPVGGDAPQEHPPLQAVEAATPKILASFVGLLAVGFVRVACARIAGPSPPPEPRIPTRPLSSNVGVNMLKERFATASGLRSTMLMG